MALYFNYCYSCTYIGDIMKEVRTRFAPSPTGYMHIGNLRTALYTFLYAKHFDGKFVLRIEDTDQKRFVEGATEVIYDTLKTTKLIHDEGPDKDGGYGPYIQSERKDIYKKYALELVDKGYAYYCFCGNHEDCPKKDKCLRVYKYNKPGIYTIAAFYNPDNEECEYFIEKDN